MCEGDYEDYVASLHAEIDDLTRRYYRAELCFITEVYGRRHGDKSLPAMKDVEDDIKNEVNRIRQKYSLSALDWGTHR